MEEPYINSEMFESDETLYDKLSQSVRTWVRLAKGEFNINEILRQLRVKVNDDVVSVKLELDSLCMEGIITACGDRNGVYRKINIELVKMQRIEDKKGPIEIKLPFNLHEKYITMPGSLIVVAAVSNGGKSTFMLNFCELNKDKHNIRYVSSEWSNEERDTQLEDFGVDIDEWDKRIDFFAKKDVSSAFDNYINPESINIIDYYENYDKAWAVSGDLRKIADKLTTGIAIVALQKKSNNDYGYGGEGTKNRAQLYINIDVNEIDPRKRFITVVKLKKPVVRQYNIERLSCEFGYSKTGRIEGQSKWGQIVVEKDKKGKMLEKYIQAEHWANQELVEDEAIEWSK